jgi:hypothetical protein
LKGKRDSSTIFLDACLNGKQIDDKNMVQHVAHRLAGAAVFASRISWDNDEFFLGTSKDFSGKIVSERTGKARMRVERCRLGLWNASWAVARGLHVSRVREARIGEQSESGVSELQQCRERCEAKSDCKSFVWYPKGNKYADQKCFLAKDFEE